MPDERVETNEESGAVQDCATGLISSQQRRYRPGDEREGTRMQAKNKKCRGACWGGGWSFLDAAHLGSRSCLAPEVDHPSPKNPHARCK